MARQKYKKGARSARSQRRIKTSLLFTWGRKHTKGKGFSSGGLSTGGHKFPA